MSVVMRMFFDGAEVSKFIKFAGKYLDSYTLVFDGSGLHVLNTDTSKVAFFSKKFEPVDADVSIVPEEPLKVFVSDMLEKIVKKFGGKGYFMFEYSEGEDHLVVGFGKDVDNWEEFYKVNLNITGTGDEVEEIVTIHGRFVELENDVGVFKFMIDVEDIKKIVQISELYDTNISFSVCSDGVTVLFTKDEKKYGSRRFRADSCELERLVENERDCVKTTVSNSIFKHLKQLPKDYYHITVGDNAPLFIRSESFMFVLAPVRE